MTEAKTRIRYCCNLDVNLLQENFVVLWKNNVSHGFQSEVTTSVSQSLLMVYTQQIYRPLLRCLLVSDTGKWPIVPFTINTASIRKGVLSHHCFQWLFHISRFIFSELILGEILWDLMRLNGRWKHFQIAYKNAFLCSAAYANVKSVQI